LQVASVLITAGYIGPRSRIGQTHFFGGSVA